MEYFVNTPIGVLAVSLLLWWLHCYMKRQMLRLQPGQLREWRKFRRLSQEQMVEKVSQYLPNKRNGLDLKTYQRWERGERQPHVRNHMALQKMLLNHEIALRLRELYGSGYVIRDVATYPDSNTGIILCFAKVEKVFDSRNGSETFFLTIELLSELY